LRRPTVRQCGQAGEPARIDLAWQPTNQETGGAAMASLVPYHDRDGVIWMDGKLVPWRDANVHLLTHGLHYASAVFEGERAYGGEIFKLTEHSERLVEGGRTMDFEIPYSVAEIDQACRDVVKANNLVDCYVRPIAWRGSEQMGVSAQQAKIHLAVAAWDWGSYFPMEQRLKGIRLTWAQYRRPDPRTAPAKTKAAGLYMICTLEKHRAERAGFADAVMLDWRGHVAECTGANIFLIKDGKIHTPTPDCFLDGITRRTVIGLAKKRGIEVIERTIMPEEMGSFQECFLTGTAAEVTPVSQIGEHTYKPAKVCETLLNDYMAAVQPQRKAAE
jgi:branched-chain amino acid aminotransferase